MTRKISYIPPSSRWMQISLFSEPTCLLESCLFPTGLILANMTRVNTECWTLIFLRILGKKPSLSSSFQQYTLYFRLLLSSQNSIHQAKTSPGFLFHRTHILCLRKFTGKRTARANIYIEWCLLFTSVTQLRWFHALKVDILETEGYIILWLLHRRQYF